MNLALGRHGHASSVYVRGIAIALGLAGASCGGAMLLKDPISDQCKSAGLLGCEQLTEGTLDYIDGEKEKGLKEIEKGAAQNSPKELKEFASALSALGNIPGVSSYMGPVLEIAAILKGDTALPDGRNVGAAAAGKSGKKEDEGEGKHVGGISNGIMRPFHSEHSFACTGDDPSTCVKTKIGPFVLTDVSFSRECGDAGIVFSVEQGTSSVFAARWLVANNVSQGRWTVADGDIMVVGVRPPDGVDGERFKRCAISWATTVH